MTTDTSILVGRRYRRMLLARSGAERLKMGCAMFDASRALMRAGLREREGLTDPTEERAQLLLRTYAEDLDPDEARLVVELLRGV
jgi:hypothetical protein